MSDQDQSLSDKVKAFDYRQNAPLLMLLALVAVLIWGYWNTLTYLAGFWKSPEYSHGYLVPLFTLALLWMRREPVTDATPMARWCGLGILAFGLLLRVAGSYFNYQYVDALSFLPSLVGVVLMTTGFPTLRWAGPALAFLIFMYPLPGFLSFRLLAPLQRVATVASTYALQTLGVEVYHEGNTIRLDKVDLGVIDQCSGLRMLTIFLALAVAITLVTQRPWWERLIIVASAIPIALLVNITRITVTGILHLTVGTKVADAVFHDFAGWVMMPLALGLLYLEIYILGQLFVEEEESEMPFAFGPQVAARPRKPAAGT
jgi:exosortase